MASFNGVIIDPVGLHARPASLLVSTASKFNANISIIVNEETANLKSIMNVMALAVRTNSKFEIVAEGKDAQAAIDEVKKVMLANKII